MRSGMVTAGLAGLALAALGTAAQADGYPPFYGYSHYYGGPATYFSSGNDVQQATTIRDGYQGFGTRTYYRGGPFWTYQPTVRTLGTAGRRVRGRRRAAVLRRAG